MKVALAVMLLLSTGCAHMTPTQQRVALYCNPVAQVMNLAVLTLGLGLAFSGGVEQMDKTAKLFPIQHCVNAVQDNAAQTPANKPQGATASASPAMPPSSRLEE
jgi:hypothetical protein